MYTWTAGIITWAIIWHSMNTVYTVYVHRGLGHNFFIFNSKLEHFFQFWMWLTAGFAWSNWQQHWAAKHRKHHKYSDTVDDPHSPYQYSIRQLCDTTHNSPGWANYISSDEVALYAPDVKSTDNWITRNLYLRYPKLGQLLLWIMFTFLFGIAGFILGGVQYFGTKTISFIVANYAFHKIGFRYAGNYGTDRSKILLPWGLFFGGEELHAHHHNDTSKPYFHRHWWELDTGWLWCRLFMFLGLMRLRNSTLT